MSGTSYVVALSHPFEVQAEGAQVPDLYSLPTCTQILRNSFTVSTTDSSGELDIVVQPNVFATVASGNGASATVNHVTGGNAWFSNPTIGGFYENGMTTATQLATYFSRYRVVSFGIRFRNLQPPLNQQGKFYIAKIPSINQFAYYPNSYTTNPQWGTYLQFYEMPGLDSSGYITNSILALPTAMEAMTSQLSLEGGIECVGKITSPVAFEWRNATNDSYLDTTSPGAPYNQSGQVLTQTSATTGQPYLVQQYDSDYLKMGGWSCIMIKGTGLPTTPGAIFDLEIIFHLEGLPPVGNTIIFSPAKNPPVHIGLLNAAVSTAHSYPTFRSITRAHSRVRDSLHKASSHLGFRDFGHLLSTLSLNGGKLGGVARQGLEIAGVAALL